MLYGDRGTGRTGGHVLGSRSALHSFSFVSCNAITIACVQWVAYMQRSAVATVSGQARRIQFTCEAPVRLTVLTV